MKNSITLSIIVYFVSFVYAKANWSLYSVNNEYSDVRLLRFNNKNGIPINELKTEFAMVKDRVKSLPEDATGCFCFDYELPNGNTYFGFRVVYGDSIMLNGKKIKLVNFFLKLEKEGIKKVCPRKKATGEVIIERTLELQKENKKKE